MLEFRIKIGQVFKDGKRDIIITDKEIRKDENGYNRKYYKYTCNKCGWTKGWIEERRILGKDTIVCACCNSQIVVEGINDIPTTAPWMIPYFQGGIEEAKLYTKGSGKYIYPICPDCGKVKNKPMNIYNIYTRHSIACSCKDNKSYNEKLMISILEQLKINYELEHSPKWSCKRRYDFYISNLNIIIETHGLQHYKGGFERKNGRNLKEEQDNDRIKKELAIENRIKEENYIVIDCRKSELEYIKQNILNSRLNEIFDLSIIDWLKVEEFALSNLIKQVCDYWNEDIYSIEEISKIVKLKENTIKKYIKQGASIGWCNNYFRSNFKNNFKNNINSKSKQVEIFKNGKSLGVFKSLSDLERKSEEIFNTKLYTGRISEVCNGKRDKYKGFAFTYV